MSLTTVAIIFILWCAEGLTIALFQIARDFLLGVEQTITPPEAV